jgi:hydrocephalus-inducing protein
MFQTRSHAFELRNTGEVALDFGWTVSAVGGGPPSLRPTQESDVYAVSPARGSLGPGAVATITVSFSPVEVEDYGRELRCAIANLPAGVEAPRLPLSGRATRPFCHFELAESDYLSAGRRPAAHGAVVSPDAKVIEFESLGVRVRNTKRFYMVNPTSISYEFEWAPDAGGGADVQSVKQSPFALHTRKGQITGGKRVEMVIDFTPEALEPVEEHWRFRIRAAGIDMPVLLVGAMREPKLTFDRTRHNFGPLLLGQRAQETVSLRNDELIPFAFAFDPKSYSSAATGDGQVIAIEPESGVVPAHGSAQLVVTFTPSAEKDFNFNLLCEVKKKATPLTLNIKGEGAAIHDAISLVEGERTLQLAAGAGQRNPCAFGSVHMNQKVVAALTVENKGRFNFDVEWSLQMPGGAVVPAAITLTPPYATAKRGSKTVFELAYKPVRAGPLPPGLVAVGQVSNGRRYELQVTGEGSMPRVSFSWLQHDFGPTFVHARGMPVETKLLRVANDDTVEHFVNVLWDSGAAVVAAAGRRPATPGGGAGADDGEADETAFEMEAAPAVLQPGEAREILVAFKPRSTRAYAVTVPIEINQLYRVGVDLRGEGCECRAELASAAMQQVQFGTVRSGAEVRRTVTLVNRSRRALELDLTAAADELAGSEITILLAKATQPGVARVALRPREAVEIALTFKPTRRAPAFSHELVARLSSRPRPLLMLLGSCEAMEVRLETEAVPFGPVVLHAAATRRLQLENQGDIGTRFDWDAAAFAPHFTIAPLSGFIGPGEDVTFELAFRPVAVSRDLYARPTLRIDGGRALPLSLTGQCVEATAQDKPLAFRARVRERASLSVPLKNSAQSAWRIKPILSSDTWEGDETIELVRARARSRAPACSCKRRRRLAGSPS